MSEGGSGEFGMRLGMLRTSRIKGEKERIGREIFGEKGQISPNLKQKKKKKSASCVTMLPFVYY